MELRRIGHRTAGLAILPLILAGTIAAQQPPAPEASAQNPPAQPSAPQTPQPTATPADPATQPAKIVVAAGTHLPLVLHNGVSTRSAQPGDPVYFETLYPIIVDNRVVIPAGSYVSGEITEAKRPGRVKGRGELMIKLNTMILPNAYIVRFNAVPSSASTGGGEAVEREGKIKGDSDKGSDVGTVVKTTSLGAGIGAIAGRSGAGAGIGAGAGAAAGLLAVLLTRGPEAELPRGTTLDVVLNRALFLDADRVNFTSPGQSTTLAGPPNREPQRNKVPF
jgi:hypothetical protein